MRRRTVALAAGALLVLWGPAPAEAVDGLVLSTPGNWLTTYTTPVAVVSPGGTLTYLNADASRHDVVALEDYAPVQCPSSPGVCPEGTPFWCLPPDPAQPWDALTNPLPFAPGSCPLFWSPLVGLGRTTPVFGTEYLQAGETYAFYCTIHRNMTGTLLALPV